MVGRRGAYCAELDIVLVCFGDVKSCGVDSSVLDNRAWKSQHAAGQFWNYNAAFGTGVFLNWRGEAKSSLSTAGRTLANRRRRKIF